MKIHFEIDLVSALFFAIVANTNSQTDEFFAVSPFAAAKSRYAELKLSEQKSRDHENEDSELRVRICEAFTRSPYLFDNYDLLPYKKNVSSNENSVENASDKELASPYKLREVVVNEFPKAEFREHLFQCPAWNRHKGEMVNFYISNEYVGNNESCRFVFAEKEQGKLVATAFVEKVPDVPAFIDKENIEELSTRMSALLEPSYAICNLSAVAKERLCTILATSKVIRYPLPRNMRTSNQEPQCVKREINYYPWRFGIKFNEWALECKVIPMTETGTTYGLPFELFISLGVEPRQVFLSRVPIQYKDKIQIFDHCFLDLDLS